MGRVSKEVLKRRAYQRAYYANKLAPKKKKLTKSDRKESLLPATPIIIDEIIKVFQRGLANR